MYPNNAYTPQQPQERRRRSDRYVQESQPSSVQGWQQPVYQQNAAPQPGYQPRQGIPPQAQQMPPQPQYSQQQMSWKNGASPKQNLLIAQVYPPHMSVVLSLGKRIFPRILRWPWNMRWVYLRPFG